MIFSFLFGYILIYGAAKKKLDHFDGWQFPTFRNTPHHFIRSPTKRNPAEPFVLFLYL
jgi:hypothetical protein